MQGQNISDVIERYLKSLLDAEEQVEIRRAAIAAQFNCVPSQINYVIKTRFTPERGYVVESKRGGGGYIRIVRMNLRADQDVFSMLQQNIPSRLNARDAGVMVRRLYEEGLVSRQTGNVMLAGLSDQTLASATPDATARQRSRLMKAFLDGLRYDN